jgi:DNA-binding NarL/FixJ family response regulator
MSSELNPHSRRDRVVIADDHPVMRAGLADLLAHEPGVELAGCADNACDAVQLVRTANPAVLVLDLSLGEDDGIAVARQLLQDRPRLKILVLSMHDEQLFADRLLGMGVRAYVTKDRTREEFIQALRSVLRGEIYVTSEQRARLTSRTASGKLSSPERLLSPRELAVLRLLASGKSSVAIAAELSVAPKTVYSHRRNISLKLGIRSGREIVRYAVHWAQGAQ